MFIRTSIFDFLQTENLTQVGNSAATVDHYNDLKLYFCVINLIVEFNVFFKSGHGIKIGKSCVEISLPSHKPTVFKFSIVLLGWWKLF